MGIEEIHYCNFSCDRCLTVITVHFEPATGATSTPNLPEGWQRSTLWGAEKSETYLLCVKCSSDVHWNIRNFRNLASPQLDLNFNLTVPEETPDGTS